MKIIETCPKCGYDLMNITLTSNLPIPKKECWNCGWSWTGESEEVVRIPFSGANSRPYLNCVDDAITEKDVREYLKNFLSE